MAIFFHNRNQVSQLELRNHDIYSDVSSKLSRVLSKMEREIDVFNNQLNKYLNEEVKSLSLAGTIKLIPEIHLYREGGGG